MLNEASLYLVVGLLVLAVVLREPLLFLLALTLLLAAGASRLWARYCLERVEFRRQLGQTRAFFGEEVELTLEVVNRKLLPLAWLEVEDELPTAIVPAGAKSLRTHKPDRSLLVNLLALRPYERVRRRYRLPCAARGDHLLGPTTLRSGDVFGFETREAVVEDHARLLVYPRVVPLAELGLPPKDPLGERAARDFLFEDPLRIAGIREYAPGDSPRRVDWKATARSGTLQVRLYEPTTTRRLLVALNLNTLGPHWSMRYEPDLVELSISVAASVASWAVDEGYQIGLIGNGYTAHSGGLLRLGPSRDPEQLTHVLEALARALPFASVGFEELLADEARSLAYGTTVVTVTALLEDELARQLRALRGFGHRPCVLLVGEEPPDVRLPGVPVRRIGGASRWREMAEIG